MNDRACSGWTPLLSTVGVVGLVLAPLLVGFEPVGWDPDLMYRPFKSELAASLQTGRLPYWSDHFGLGVPLVAESHVAAFYPPNWIAYRFLDLHTAYSLLMWLHYVACALATYAYARVLGISGWGSALAGAAFTLGGFQASHACHEPFYTLMPYLPLCLLLTERYLASGRLGWLAALALSWGAQITLGHFQIQMWTGGLVVLTGCWRGSWRRTSRLALGLTWGLAVASVQLVLTRELVRVAEFNRPSTLMLGYMVPTQQLAQWVFPPLFQPHHLTPMHEQINIEPYWKKNGTTPEEACSYIGVAALVLACVGAAAISAGSGDPRRASERRVGDCPDVPRPKPSTEGGGESWKMGLSPCPHGDPRPSTLRMWLWVSVVAAGLATMLRWWPRGYEMLVELPLLGWFRASARYMVLPSLGLSLLAGRGLDRSMDSKTFNLGILLALGLFAAGATVAARQLLDADFRAVIGPRTIPWRLAASALAWGLSAVAVLAWRRGRLGGWAPFAASALELAGLFYLGPTLWGRPIPFPGSSPLLARLKQEKEVGLVAGRLQNLPARLGLASARPLLGIVPPPPTSLLDPSCYWFPENLSPVDARWQRRFGVSHGIWTAADVVRGVDIIAEGKDDVLSGLLETGRPVTERGGWKLVRYRDPSPRARLATRARLAEDWETLYTRMAYTNNPGEVWFLPGDLPPEARSNHAPKPTMMEPDIDLGPPARSAKVVDWDGRTGTVEHDGSCVLILRRAYYPGWRARINDGPERLVSRVGYHLQGVVLTGRGPSRIVLSYHPTQLNGGKAMSLSAVVAALAVIAGSSWRARRKG